jgi:hypothetical protein
LASQMTSGRVRFESDISGWADMRRTSGLVRF